MKREQRLLRAYGARTRLGQDEERALLERLERAGLLSGETGQLARCLPGPQGQPELRLSQASGLPSRGWLALPLAALAAAAVLFFLSQRAAEPLELEAALDSQASWSELAPSPALRLAYQGQGSLAGQARAPHIQWHAGTLEVQVEPGQGVALRLSTREAELRVIGTAFQVKRNGPRTQVAVRQGEVEVSCHAGAGALLSAGQEHACGPVSAAAWLGLALGQRDQGQHSEAVLRSLDAGLALARADSVTAAELRFQRVQVLKEADRHQEALDEARELLKRFPEHRRGQLQELVEERSGQQEGVGDGD